MHVEVFHFLLARICDQLTEEARTYGFRKALDFENRVREVTQLQADLLDADNETQSQIQKAIDLENGNVPLDDAINKFNEAMLLSKECTAFDFLHSSEYTVRKIGTCGESRGIDFSDGISGSFSCAALRYLHTQSPDENGSRLRSR